MLDSWYYLLFYKLFNGAMWSRQSYLDHSSSPLSYTKRILSTLCKKYPCSEAKVGLLQTIEACSILKSFKPPQVGAALLQSPIPMTFALTSQQGMVHGSYPLDEMLL